MLQRFLSSELEQQRLITHGGPVPKVAFLVQFFFHFQQIIGRSAKFKIGLSCPSWQWHRTGYLWSPVWTLPVAPLWCDLGHFSWTVVVITLRQISACSEVVNMSERLSEIQIPEGFASDKDWQQVGIDFSAVVHYRKTNNLHLGRNHQVLHLVWATILIMKHFNNFFLIDKEFINAQK